MGNGVVGHLQTTPIGTHATTITSAHTYGYVNSPKYLTMGRN